MPHGECFLGLGFAQHTPALCSTHRSSGNVILPNPRTLDEYTPHQYWSANFIIVEDFLQNLVVFSWPWHEFEISRMMMMMMIGLNPGPRMTTKKKADLVASHGAGPTGAPACTTVWWAGWKCVAGAQSTSECCHCSLEEESGGVSGSSIAGCIRHDQQQQAVSAEAAATALSPIL